MGTLKKKHNNEGREIWFFRHGIDTPASYEAFTLFRDMGARRTVAKLAELIPNSKGSLNSWCDTGEWVPRAIAYDVYLDRQKVAAIRKKEVADHLKKINKYRREHENLGWANLTIAGKCLEICDQALQYFAEEPERIREMRPGDVRNLVAAAKDSADIGSKLLSDSLAVARLLETMPIDVEVQEIDDLPLENPAIAPGLDDDLLEQ